MLSNPNINEIMPKVGNRYESAIALAKRARKIAKNRLEEGSDDIRDAVDVAGEEIENEKVYVKKNGKYVVEPNVIEDEEMHIEAIVKE
ncbi:dNA-directed RNA polymerase subunit omega [Clostridium sp. CAG:1219]|nr:dNA-directed RNA polymerase subunit omega [Clostridium sp. CAG:1219]